MREKKRTILRAKMALVVFVLIAGIQVGCTSKTEETALSDEDQIRKLIDGDQTGWFDATSGLNDTLKEDSIPSVVLRPQEGDTFPFIRGWGRERISRTGEIIIEVDGDTAYATLDFDLEGILHVAGPDTAIEKPFLDHSHREALFVKDGDPRWNGGWRLKAISMAEITTEDGSMNIDSVRVVGGDIDTMITDPSLLTERDSILAFPPETPVDIYVYVADPTETLAFLHHWGRFRPHHRSGRFFYDPETGALKGTWVTPAVEGLYHVAVDAMTWTTLFVMSSPYDSEAWVTPYRVVP